MRWLEQNVEGSDLIVAGILLFAIAALAQDNDTLASAALGMVGGYVTKSAQTKKEE